MWKSFSGMSSLFLQAYWLTDYTDIEEKNTFQGHIYLLLKFHG